jgi:hypothetical protein
LKNGNLLLKKNTGFRFWFYFRSGWSSYFAFLFAAINTMTVTYYLAIERYPLLEGIFPNFLQYVLIMASIGIPFLTLVGYAHWKRTPAYRSEADVWFESNPYFARILVNTSMILELNLRLLELTTKMSKNEQLTNEELEEIKKLREQISLLIKDRTLSNKKDLAYFKQTSD